MLVKVALIYYQYYIIIYIIISGQHNLLWYLGVFSAIFAGTRSLIPELKPKVKESHEELMEHIAAFTHYYPTHWDGLCHTQSVKNEFEELFPYKVTLFLMEVLSVLLTPLVLCFSLPQTAEAIVDFIRENSTYVDGLGAVCVFSLFQIEKYGDENYGAPAAASKFGDENQKLENGKLEQSFINFQQQHPHWHLEGDAGGRSLLEKIHKFRRIIENQRDEEQVHVLQDSLSTIINRSNAKVSFSALDMSRQKIPSGLIQGSWGPRGYAAETDNATETDQDDQDDHDPLLPKTSIKQLEDRSIEMFMSESRSSNINRNDIPSILRSIMKQENIDYENDFYWLNKFQHQHRKDTLASSINISKLINNIK